MANLLIIEDNPANMRLAVTILMNAGHVVREASDAATGLALVQAKPPDLILMDVQMPGMDGLTATRTLKSDPATQAIPVIAVTALAMSGDTDKILAAGCDGYISKPIRYRELLAQVDAALAAHGHPPSNPDLDSGH